VTAAADSSVSAAESDEFLRAVGRIAPIAAPKKRVEPEKRLESALPDDDTLALAELQALVEGDTPFHVVESEEFYSGSAPGVSHELVDKLREGAFSFRRHVDLHGYTRDDAKTALTDFIAAARRDGERCVLVITGRGKSSPGGISVLREALPRWLGRFPLRSHVLAFCTASSVDGGPGAFYVLLRRLGSRPYVGP
jgi:DNA-nicking Smr family endonuclease